MGKFTRVPEVLADLASLVAAQPDVDQQALIVGGKTVNEYLDYIVFLGYRPLSEEWVASTREAPRGLQANDAETVTVGVLVAATNGDDDMVKAIQRVGEKVHAIERVVTENPTLRIGKGVTATIGDMAWQPLHTPKGAECNVTFDIKVKVLL
jgi:hypothetical protein